MAVNPDQLYVTCNKQIYVFETFSLTRGVARVPMILQASSTDYFGQSYFDYEDPITAYLGSQLVFTGFIDRITVNIKAGVHVVAIMARSAMRNLVKCSIDINSISGVSVTGNVFQIAQQVAAPMGIEVVNKSKQDLDIIYALPFTYGQTPWDLIEQAARYCGVLLLDNELGQLVIDDVGSSTMASGAQLGVNVEEVSTMLSIEQQYSDVYVVVSAPNQVTGTAPSPDGYAHNKYLDAYAPLYIVCEQATTDFLALTQKRADWEVAQRLGAGFNAQIVLATWRDKKGNLFVPNALIDIDLSKARWPASQLVITSVTYSKSLAGTHAVLSVTYPQALMPEPLAIANEAALLKRSAEATDASKAMTAPASNVSTAGLQGHV